MGSKELIVFNIFWFCGHFQGLIDKKGHYLCVVILEEYDNPRFPHFFGLLGGKVYYLKFYLYFKLFTFIFYNVWSYFITNKFEMMYA